MNKEWLLKLIKPSTLITLVLIVSIVSIPRDPNASPELLEIYADVIKVLAGALAGAVAGENLSKKEDQNAKN